MSGARCSEIVRGFKIGFTLIEAMVAITIMGFIAVGLFYMLSSANRTRALADAKGNAKNEVEVALRQLTRDIQMARAPTPAQQKASPPKKFALVFGTSDVTFDISEEDTSSHQILTKEVSYAWDLPSKKLDRTYDGKTRPLMTHLSAFEMDYDPSATTSGTIMIKIEAAFYPEGVQASQSYSQETTATVHEEAKREKDDGWKKAKEILGTF